LFWGELGSWLSFPFFYKINNQNWMISKLYTGMEQPKLKIIPSEPIRICSKCGEGKPLNNENFSYKGRKRADGTDDLDTRCLECKRAQDLINRKKNPCKAMWKNKKADCKKKGIPFDLTPEYLKSIAPVHCPVFPWMRIHYGGGKQVDNTASIDRINPNGGYTKGNVQILSLKANRCKSNLDEREQMAIAMFFIRSNK
jgi:hypothetical protein